MNTLDKAKNEKQQVFEDVYDGIIPKRIPINAVLPLEFCIQHGGLPLGETQWTFKGVEEAADILCKMIPFDITPLGVPRYPAHFHILGAKTYEMSASGFMQHPEVMGMKAEDYDEFINNPRDTIIEKIMPKLFTSIDTNPINSSLVFAKAILANVDYLDKHGALVKKLIDKYKFFSAPKGSVSAVTAPFDYLSDFLRSFTGINRDIRRCPEKVAQSCEALLPYLFKKAMPPIQSNYGQTFIPLHMATYLRTKDFEDLYWPSFLKLVHAMADAGQTCYIFCEDDWMRYLDYLYELPTGTRFCFEYGNPQKVKDKLGKKHVISGLYPITYLKTATKQQCIDKAKEIIDIMAPGGNYIFNFDKNPFVLNDINLENYIAVLEYVSNNTNYANAGEESRSKDKEIKHKADEIPQFKSKYYKNLDDHKEMHSDADLGSIMAPILSGYEEQVMSFLMRLL